MFYIGIALIITGFLFLLFSLYYAKTQNIKKEMKEYKELSISSSLSDDYEPPEPIDRVYDRKPVNSFINEDHEKAEILDSDIEELFKNEDMIDDFEEDTSIMEDVYDSAADEETAILDPDREEETSVLEAEEETAILDPDMEEETSVLEAGEETSVLKDEEKAFKREMTINQKITETGKNTILEDFIEEGKLEKAKQEETSAMDEEETSVLDDSLEDTAILEMRWKSNE